MDSLGFVPTPSRAQTPRASGEQSSALARRIAFAFPLPPLEGLVDDANLLGYYWRGGVLAAVGSGWAAAVRATIFSCRACCSWLCAPAQDGRRESHRGSWMSLGGRPLFCVMCVQPHRR
jgi:hypothetical protein